jgi:hypothetical protein
VLLGLVGCGVLLPLIVVSWYMLSSNKFAGPNRIMQETLAIYYHSKFSVKESQVRMWWTTAHTARRCCRPAPSTGPAPEPETMGS